jgi:tetrahydromethanopterin S-methyltransferase subunit D
MHNFSKFLFTIISFFISCISFAQVQQVEMADTMRSNGKIYTVVLVCLSILIGLFIYVYSIDRKISSIEKNNN